MHEGGEAEPQAIKVLIVDLPRLLAIGVKNAIEAQQDMMIVAQLDRSDALAARLARSADVIVTGPTVGEPTLAYRRALFGDRVVPIVAISAEGNSIDVYSCKRTHGYG